MKLVLLSLVAIAVLLCGTYAEVQMRWCYMGNEEKSKCEAMKTAARSVVKNLAFTCVDGKDTAGCVKLMKENKADLVGMDGGEIMEAESDVIPIVSEKHAGTGIKYYAVAVAKQTNLGFSMKNLKGVKTCHTGARKSAGWILPVGYMLSEDIMPSGPCNAVRDFLAVADFFNQSCVPNVNSFNTSGNIPSKLCALCKGDCSSKDEYADYLGAFRCMNDGRGDVAFVKHTTAQEFADANAGASTGDYQYLCKDGTRKAIGQHENCNLGYSPAHAVVTRKGAEQIDTYVQVLVKLNATFGIDQKNSSGFQLFNSTKYGGENLLFKDSAVALQEITKKTVKDYFGDYYTDYKAINCKEPKPTGTSQPTSKATALAVQLIIVPLSMLVTLLAGRM